MSTASSLLGENNKALKEWGTVIEALTSGKQTILIRRRSPVSSEFFLYPTFGPKQTRKSFQKQFHGIYDNAMASKPRRKVKIRCYAQVKENIEVNNVERLKNLSDHYIWTSSHVADYFKKSKRPRVYVVILRIFQLPEPKIIDILPGISWVNLPEPISIANCVPVLGDEEFSSRFNKIKVKVEKGVAKLTSAPPDGLRDYISKSTEIIKRNASLTEATTKVVLVEPLFKVLGWDTLDPIEVDREYNIPAIGERVDIALKIMGRPRIFIETKRWDSDKELNDSMARQIIKYAKLGDVDWCVLTDGNETRVYNASWKGDISERLFFKLSLSQYLENRNRIFLLSKQSVEKRELDERGVVYFTRKRFIEWLRNNKEKLTNEILEWDRSLKKEYVLGLIERLE